MYLLSFLQKERETHIGLFETLENGREFVSNIPGYHIVEEVIDESSFVYETIAPDSFPDYFEVEYKGNRLPLTRYMFEDDSQVDIIWREFTFFDIPDQGMAKGATLVDAYCVAHEEVGDYIQKREETYRRVSEILSKMGYVIERSFRGSEDGEAIIVKKKDGKFHFFDHMDPCFVDQSSLTEEELEEYVKDNLND